MSKFGATFFPKNKFNFPLKFISSKMPIGINYKAGVSAQIKKCSYFAGLNSYGENNYIRKVKKKAEIILKICYLKIKNHKNLIKKKKKLKFLEKKL